MMMAEGSLYVYHEVMPVDILEIHFCVKEDGEEPVLLYDQVIMHQIRVAYPYITRVTRTLDDLRWGGGVGFYET